MLLSTKVVNDRAVSMKKFGRFFETDNKTVRGGVAKRRTSGRAKNSPFTESSGIRESNPHLSLGKAIYYHCTNPATKRELTPSFFNINYLVVLVLDSVNGL